MRLEKRFLRLKRLALPALESIPCANYLFRRQMRPRQAERSDRPERSASGSVADHRYTSEAFECVLTERRLPHPIIDNTDKVHYFE